MSSIKGAYKKTHDFLGFKKGYNFILWFVFAGALFGFSLARLQYLDLDGSFSKKAAPGEWFWMRKGALRVGLLIHLACVLPMGLLIVFQFVPIIRRNFMTFHRVNGYIVAVLILLSNAGASIIGRRSFGGDLSIQSAVYLLVLLTTVSLGLAYYNIKKLQIDQHRNWMLRLVFYLGTIITTRLIMIISALCVSAIGSYYSLYRCDELLFTVKNHTRIYEMYPLCKTGLPTDVVAVKAMLTGSNVQAETAGAALRTSFGMAIWLALAIHAIGVEIYIRLTPAESERLRLVSMERQIQAGYRSEEKVDQSA